MYYLLDRVIYLLLYLSLLIGVWLILYPLFSSYFNNIKRLKRFRYGLEKKNRTKIRQHLEMLLSISLHTKSFYSFVTFLSVSFGIAFISFLFLITSGKQSFIISLTVSSIAGLIPYLTLYMKLHNIRINSSYEAEFLLTEIINQYKINHLNMVEAIDRTIPKLRTQPNSKTALTRLSLAIKQYQSNEELEAIIKEFYFSINTSWGMLLANNLFLSIEFGSDVLVALEDILMDLKDLKAINERDRQYNHETFVMIKFIGPFTYLFSIFSMFTIFGFTLERYIKYQFMDPIGFKFFLLTMLFMLLNYILYLFIRKPKNDF